MAWEEVDKVTSAITDELPDDYGEVGHVEETTRMAVPGGWICRVTRFGEHEVAISTCFVPEQR